VSNAFVCKGVKVYYGLLVGPPIDKKYSCEYRSRKKPKKPLVTSMSFPRSLLFSLIRRDHSFSVIENNTGFS
jgi:hypothetical protein